MMRLSGLDHGVHVFGRVGNDIEKDRPILQFQGFLQSILNVSWFLYQHPDMAIAFGEFHEIGDRVEVGMGIPALVGKFLPLPDHAHEAVVQVDDLYPCIVLQSRRQFLQAHLDACLTSNADHIRIRVCQFDSDRGR